jgi:hypothetical protein
MTQPSWIWIPIVLAVAGAQTIRNAALGAVAQLVATAFLIRAMATRSFVVAVTYSKTEILQIGVLSVALLAEPVTAAAAAAIALASVGVLLLSAKPGAMPGADLRAWLSPSAAIGLASGACFALSAVGYRGAAVALGHPLRWVSGIFALVIAGIALVSVR